MGILNKIFGSVSGLLNAIAPIAMLIPGMQWVSIAAMVANVGAGLTAKPPDFAGILTNLVSSAIPMGLGKALSAFKGGTALEFAKLFGDKLSGTLGEVAAKVGNPQMTNVISQMQSKITNEAFQTRFAGLVNKLTGTKADDQLTADQIGQHINELAYNTRDYLGPVAQQLSYPLTQATSTFNAQPEPTPVVIPQTISGTPVVSSAPTMRVPPPMNG